MVPRTPTASVIMVARNAERQVRRAVESLQNQSLGDFELLVVDAGSRDRTGDILDKIAERDIRISVFHSQDDDVDAAHAFALERARGTYVQFVDAVDWVEPGMLEDMVALAERSHLELVVCGFQADTYYGDQGDQVSEVMTRPDAVYPTQHEFRAAAWQLFDQNLFYAPWNKLFLRQRIEDLGLCYANGLSFVLRYIRDLERAGMIEQAYYHRVRDLRESVRGGWRPDLFEQHEEEHGQLLDLYRHWGLDGDAACMEMIQRHYLTGLVDCLENVCNPACTLSTRDKLAHIETMICSDHAQLAVATAHPRSRMAKAILTPVRAKSVRLAYREGKLISFVWRHNAKMLATREVRR